MSESPTISDSALQDIKEEVYSKILDEIGSLIEIRADSVENAGITDIWIAGQPLGKVIEGNREKCATVEKQIEETLTGEAADGSIEEETDETREDLEQERELLPIERLERFGEDHVALANVTASVDRARTLFAHFREWASKTPAGRVIKSNLRALLSTACETSLSWKQIYRACEKLEEWSKGAIEFKKTDRHGWILVEKNDKLRTERRTSSVG